MFGTVHFTSESTIPVLEITSASLNDTNSAVVLSTSSSAAPKTLFIGDLRLTSLKTRLTALKIEAEFAGEGVLVCGTAGEGLVAVRKVGRGKIVVEGAASRNYYMVRREVYGSHAQV